MAGGFGSNFSHQIEKNDEQFFDKIVYRKNKGRWKNYMPINSNKLKYFEKKVYDMWWFTRWGCDYRTLSCVEWCNIWFASCFREIVNDSNSNFKRIDCSEINNIPNYKMNIVLADNEDDTTYGFDALTYDLIPDDFNEILITKNTDKKWYDEYFVDITSMWWKNYRLFRFQFYNWAYLHTNNWAREWEIVVYGTCCRLEAIYEDFNRYRLIQRLIQWHCDYEDTKQQLLLSLNRFYYTRYDFRIDFFIPEEDYKPLKASDIFTKSKDTNTFTIDDDISNITKQEFFNRKWVYTWWCAWNRKNKYIFCRQYHKKIDIIRNGDEELYADYHIYDGIIWRLEFEFGSRFLTSRWRIYISERQDFLLNALVNEYLGVAIQTGPFSKCYDKVPSIPFDLQSNSKRGRKLSYMASVWDELYKSWRDVIGTIIHAMASKYWYDEIDIQRIIDRFDKKNIQIPKKFIPPNNKTLDDILNSIDFW